MNIVQQSISYSQTVYRLVRSVTLYIFVGIATLLCCAWLIASDAQQKYEATLSVVVYDRHNVPLSIAENSKGHYVHALPFVPTDFETLLLTKEDRYFYFHPGVNPVSTLRAVFSYFKDGETGGSSTLTQQLAKNLLGTEVDRTIVNKLRELAYALSLELFTSKRTILLMYTNSAYLGHQVQGFDTASYAYFNKPLAETSHSEKISLLSTLSYPSTRNPWEPEGAAFSVQLHEKISPTKSYYPPEVTDGYSFQHPAYFELQTAGITCAETCVSTIDESLTTNIRSILDRNINAGWEKNIRNGAVVVIDPKTSQLIAMVGSRDPKSERNGNQINMALAPRPIGSTIKPLIYAKGFEAGLRPYSIVEDREYKFPIASGFSLYPKNYDGLYHGAVTLHEALSNSLNVPSVKTLEYIGLPVFYEFLTTDLAFVPIQPLDSYQYGIALGGLEMDLLTLTHYFTLFPQVGSLAPLVTMQSSSQDIHLPPQSRIEKKSVVVSAPYVQLVHAIISDRFTGVNQFGLASNLNLTIDDYGVKTGTSRDFHDSWVIGYTGDFVVGVWLGNSENEPLDQVSGSSGAGAAWREVMEYLINTDYYRATPVSLNSIERIIIDGNSEWGLGADVTLEHQQLLLEDTLILSVHEGDVFELSDTLTIPLRARRVVAWSINGEALETAQDTNFIPTKAGVYEIIATDPISLDREIIMLRITQPE